MKIKILKQGTSKGKPSSYCEWIRRRLEGSEQLA